MTFLQVKSRAKNLKNYKITKLQNYKITKLQNYKIIILNLNQLRLLRFFYFYI
jgi:hypothetical protein